MRCHRLSVWFLFFYWSPEIINSSFADQLTISPLGGNAYFIFTNRTWRYSLAHLKLSRPLGAKCAHMLFLLCTEQTTKHPLQLGDTSLWDLKGETMCWAMVALLVGVWTAPDFNASMRRGREMPSLQTSRGGLGVSCPGSVCSFSNLFSFLP